MVSPPRPQPAEYKDWQCTVERSAIDLCLQVGNRAVRMSN